MPEPIDDRRTAFAALRGVIAASGAPGEAQAGRLRRVAALFGLGPGAGDGAQGILTPEATLGDDRGNTSG